MVLLRGSANKKSVRTTARARLLAATLLTGVLCGIGGAPPATATVITGSTPTQLATAIVADPTTLVGASYVAVPPSGTPNGVSTSPIAGFPTTGSSFAVLTTGDASLAEKAPGTDSGGIDDGGGNVRGNTDFDVTILKVDVNVPSTDNCLLGFDFKFLSEEYPRYVGTQYNDAFIAELDHSSWTTSGSMISAPNNFAFDPKGNPISINATGPTSMTASSSSGTPYGGATPILTASTPISPGPHSIYFSIFDQGDHVLDSAVFMDNLAFGSVGDPATQCVPGARTGRWTHVGPGPYVDASSSNYDSGQMVTGRVLAASADPRTAGSVLIGAEGGGIWMGRQTSGGEAWTPVGDQLGSMSVASLARDPRNASVVYAGTGEDAPSTALPPGNGIFASRDGGLTWSATGPPPTFGGLKSWYGVNVPGLAVSSTGTIVAATGVGLLTSIDGGTTWSLVQPFHFSAVAVDPASAQNVWATSVSGADDAFCNASVWQSTDGGMHFSKVMSFGDLTTGPYDAGAGMGVGAGGWVYVNVSNCKGELFKIFRRNPSQGMSFVPIGDKHDADPSNPTDTLGGMFGGVPRFGQGNFDNVVAVDPSPGGPCRVVFGAVQLWETSNGCDKGKSKPVFYDVTTRTQKIHGDIHALQFLSDGTVYAGSDGGIYRFDPGSIVAQKAPVNLNRGALDISQFYGGQAFDTSHLAGGTQDDGTPAKFGGSWAQCGGGDGGSTVFATDGTGNPTSLYYQQDINLYGNPTGGCPAPPNNFVGPCQIVPKIPLACDDHNGHVDSVQFPNPPLIFDHDLGSAFMATTRVFATHQPSAFGWADASGSVVTSPHGYRCSHWCPDYVAAMAENEINCTPPQSPIPYPPGYEVWTASAYGDVKVTANAPGCSFNGVHDETGNLPRPSPSTKQDGVPWITSIVSDQRFFVTAASALPGGAWVGFGGNVTTGGHVWHFDGTTWADASTPSSGLPHYPVTAIQVAPGSGPGIKDVYVGLGTGGVYVCRSCNAAAPQWTVVGRLPATKVSDLTLSNDGSELFAWTYGRGVWATRIADRLPAQGQGLSRSDASARVAVPSPRARPSGRRAG